MARITLEEAQKLIFQAGNTVEAVWCPAEKATGRILAENLEAKMMQPPFARSAMDGYALREADVRNAGPEHPSVLRVVYKTCAGDRPGRAILPGECVRIMTGAVIPEGADCVIRQEDTDYGEAAVRIYTRAALWQNCCRAGEDFLKGDILAKAGDRVDAYTAAAAVAAGHTGFRVRRKLKAAVIATGEELREAGSVLEPGQIYNSNRTYLQFRLTEAGCETVFCKTTGDDPDRIAEALQEAAAEADFVITTGGVSVGQKDQLPHVMEMLGARNVFRGLALKPGMPTLCSVLGTVPVLSLSGNPYSAFSVFELLLRPLMAGLLGADGYHYIRLRTVTASGFPKASTGRRLLRGYYDGEKVYLSGKQQNGQLTGGIGANCLADIPAGSGPVEAGMPVEIILTGMQ